MIVRTPSFLMANLGSEITRLYLAREKDDPLVLAQCRDRAFRITNEIKHLLTLEGRAGEAMLLEFLIEDVVNPVPLFSVTREELESYFIPFALRTLQQV